MDAKKFAYIFHYSCCGFLITTHFLFSSNTLYPALSSMDVVLANKCPWNKSMIPNSHYLGENQYNVDAGRKYQSPTWARIEVARSRLLQWKHKMLTLDLRVPA